MEKVTWLKKTAGQKSKEKLKNDEIGYHADKTERLGSAHRLLFDFQRLLRKAKDDKRTTHKEMGV